MRFVDPIPLVTPFRPSIELTDAQFNDIRTLVHRVAGIKLGPGKTSLVRSRVLKRLRALSMPTVSEYLAFMHTDATREELAALIDVLTTNKTSFFREAEHFRLLEKTILPACAASGEPIRIWSAGCSTGEEPYTIAIVASETLGKAVSGRVRILATDISKRVIEHSRAAEYETAVAAGVSDALRARHFERPSATGDETLRVVRQTRSLVQFARLNLMAEWPMRGRFTVIFCRNVMIYFDKPTQQRLVDRFTELLMPGGYLLLGHSESLTGMRHSLGYVQPATYRKQT